uniref:Endosome-associated-trafficking regulator 1 n=1 Tax=Anabas testudineus TaxID=64144 RepID=A0A3Q1IR04_ANATE
MSGPKRLIIADDEEVEPEESNPFSFREFLRCKNQDLDQDQEQTHSKTSCSQKMFDVGDLTFDPEVGSCFFSEPSLAPQEEEEWGRSFQSGVDSTSSLCTEEDDDEEEEETRFSSKPDVQQRRGGAKNYEGDDETSMAEHVSCRRRSYNQQLKEENISLRRTIRELQRRTEANERRVLELSEELLQRRRQEEKEAQDLESMVHSVEQNLHLMTVEVESLRSENDRLKVAESQVVMTMRQNAQVASEYLNKTASHAHSSIRRLLEEAETLRLVSQLLQSIDKISNLHTET